MKKLFFCLMMISSIAKCQELKIKNTASGMFSFGMRNVISTFNDGSWSNRGQGIGGQLRLQLSDKVNTDWFADFINGNIGKLGYRNDAHIGWSVLYYLKSSANKPCIQPYILAGHCFDYSYQHETGYNNSAKKFSSAVQAGCGFHFNLTKRFDVSTTAQYMIHVGSDIDAIEKNNRLDFVKKQGVGWEGHLLLNLSLNYKIIDLW